MRMTDNKEDDGQHGGQQKMMMEEDNRLRGWPTRMTIKLVNYHIIDIRRHEINFTYVDSILHGVLPCKIKTFHLISKIQQL